MQTRIEANTVVTLDYCVKDIHGVVVDEGADPLVYLHGGYDDIFPKIEATLDGKGVNDGFRVELQAKDAFGEYDEDLVQVESREDFPAELEVGMQFEGAPEGASDEDSVIYRVTEILDDRIVLDANHPLAGFALVFEGTVSGVRAARADEVAAGHVIEQ